MKNLDGVIIGCGILGGVAVKKFIRRKMRTYKASVIEVIGRELFSIYVGSKACLEIANLMFKLKDHVESDIEEFINKIKGENNG